MKESPAKRKIIGSGSARWLGYSSALVIALGLVALVLMVEVSSQPQFCGTCHVMAPYYESWTTSSHSDIACVDCHIPPGVAHEINKKWEALSMVASYFTATYGTKPWAEIDDAACLRCHERRLLAGQEVFGDVLFNHGPHLNDLRRGKRLRCTSCHSQIVQGEHIAVTTSTCILCHFKDQQVNQGTARCELCHNVPERVVQKGLVSFDHSDVRRFAMDCSWCHTSQTISSQGGGVPRERCYTCHNDPSRVAEYEQTDLMHRTHVTDHKVDCLNCHLEIPHGDALQQAESEGSCQRCHQGGHSPQSDLYTGVGGRGVQPMPAPMHLAGVACEGCHIRIPGHTAETSFATEVSCMSCHGPRYRPVLGRWREGVDERTGALRRQLQSTAALFPGREPETLMDARHNLELVEKGRGVHNVRYAFALLAKSHEFINEARRAAGYATLDVPWQVASVDSPCLGCHEGIETQQGEVFGRAFSHRSHVVVRKLGCEQCHRPHEEKAPGEVLRYPEAGCNSCHHLDMNRDCKACHSDVLRRTVSSFRGTFSHELHLGMGAECSSCHRISSDQPRRIDRDFCSACHEE